MQYIAYIFIVFVSFAIFGGLSGNVSMGALSSVIIFSIIIIIEKLDDISKKWMKSSVNN